MRNKILILIGLFIVVVGLFFFSQWTNAQVVAQQDISQGLSAAFSISPFLIGLFLVLIIAVSIILSGGAHT